MSLESLKAAGKIDKKNVQSQGKRRKYINPINRRVDTGLTEKTKLTEIRQFGPFSDFNSTLRNLRVLKYKFEIVTIVELDHILNLKKKN